MKTVVDAYKEVELLIYLFRLFGFFMVNRSLFCSNIRRS